MFETLIRTSQVRPAWKSTVVISLLAHSVAITLLILLPMVYFQVVDVRFLTGIVVADEPDPVPPSPPPTPRPAAPQLQPRGRVLEVRLPPMTLPPTIPVGVPPEYISDLPVVGWNRTSARLAALWVHLCLESRVPRPSIHPRCPEPCLRLRRPSRCGIGRFSCPRFRPVA